MFEFGWQKIVLWGSFIFFLGAALLRQETAINQDLGRHLRLGEMIIAGGEDRRCALFTNCFTYTYPDYPFVNHHWGSEVIFYLVHKIGGFPALIILKAIVLGLAFAITARHAIASKGPTFGAQRLDLSKLAIAVALTFLSIQMMADRLTTRPEIFGYLLFSLLFWILNRKNLGIWGILGIWGTMLLWANLHISFVFGLILIYLWSFSALINKGPALRRKARPYQIIAIPAISTVITILNPAGLRGVLMPLSIMKDYGYTVVENMTPFFLRAFKPQPEYWIYALILLATIIIGVIRPSSAKATEGKGFGKVGMFGWITLLIFSIFPLMAVRHLAFFGLTVAPVLTPLLAVKFRKLNSDWKFAKLPILVAGSLLVAAVTNPVPLAYGKLPPVGLSEDRRHEEAVKFVKNHLPRQGRGEQGKMWNNYDIGSYLEWSLPEYPTFVDGRPEAFPAGFFRETYIPMQESRQKWDEVVEKYDIQWVFAALTDATPWFGKWQQMINKHEGWKIVYIDKSTAILIRQ